MRTTENAGFSSDRLATLDKVMTERYVDSGALPGYQAMIYRQGELVHNSTVGSMDLERDRATQDDAIYRIYSMSKPITAVALMMLVEEGKLGLDDDVHLYIPSWKNLGVYSQGIPPTSADAKAHFVTVPPKRPMKIVDLVTHTSGLTYGFMSRTTVDATYRIQQIGDMQTPGGLDEFIEQLSKVPLDFSPGETWNYSVSIDVVGYLVQLLSGQTFGEFLQNRLFEPLQMKDTSFFVPEEKMGRFTSCYMPKQGGGLGLQDDAGASTYAVPPKLESGGGGLVSTAADYMRFCQMMLNGGTLDGVQILSPKTVDMFGENFLPEGKLMSDMTPEESLFSESGYDGIGFSIGCGVTVDTARARISGTPGEFFWGGAASTAFWIDPKEQLAVVFMTQVIGSDARLNLRRDLRALVYSAFTESLT
jgi:CubicO group peptidase (beta-lactamase class C family)